MSGQHRLKFPAQASLRFTEPASAFTIILRRLSGDQRPSVKSGQYE
jgi:hypothetical protein